MLRRNLSISARAIKAHPLRSSLTILGVVIGVAALVTMVSVSMGAQRELSSRLESLGLNTILILPGSVDQRGVRQTSGSIKSLTEADAQAIEREVALVRSAAAYTRMPAQVVASNRNWRTSIAGASPSYFEIRQWKMREGDFYTALDEEGRRKVVVLGATVVSSLFRGSSGIVGQEVRINGSPFRVVGVLEPKGPNPMGADQDDVAFIPLSTLQTRFAVGHVTSRRAVSGILANSILPDATDVAIGEIEALLRDRHGIDQHTADDFVVRDQVELMNFGEAANRQFTILVSVLAAVSLFVGGIGIMNVLLVSVVERTREIGLRIAIGARRIDLQLQFLSEAIILTLIGGIVGSFLGILTSIFVSIFVGWPTSIGLTVIGLGILSAVLVGLIFGVYPAIRASRMSPIEALRAE